MNLSYTYACFLSVLAYSGLFGSILVIVVLLKEKLLHEASFIIMLSLAFADIGNLSMMTFHSLPETVMRLNWPDWYERLANRTTLVFWFTSLGHYLIMAANRFVAVRYPFQLAVWFSLKRTILYIVFTWIVGTMTCCVSFSNICCDQVFAIHENLDTSIEQAVDEGDFNYLKAATNIIDVIVIVILIVLYVFTYSGINKTVPSSITNNYIANASTHQQNENNRRAALTLRVSLQFAIISVIFGFLVVAEVLSDFRVGGAPLKAVLQFAFILNAGANVIIYSTFNSTFRKHLIKTLLCCKKQEMAEVQVNAAIRQEFELKPAA